MLFPIQEIEQNIFEVKNLSVSFIAKQQSLRIIDRVNFILKNKSKTALVGESGSGKSVLAQALFGLLPKTAQITGRAVFKNELDLLGTSNLKEHHLRGNQLVLVPQNPLSHLNPSLRIGYQIREGIKNRRSLSGRQKKHIILDLLSRVGFEEPEIVSTMYPHQLSGGMAQRVLLAIGLSGTPDFVVADEPTRGLDIKNQQRYLELIKKLYQNCSLLMITHNLEVAKCCDRVMVMYGGEIVEIGAVDQVLNRPRHPYTMGLLQAHPDRGMVPIPGQTFSFSTPLKGCRFHSRCQRKKSECCELHPPLEIINGAGVRCFYVGD
ncbi:ABC transporter ATP-binding protein [bacterium]|nr:ABC transporter ATP-binding protein [bacterium]